MMKKIDTVAYGYNILMDNNEIIHYDHFELTEILGYDDNIIIGYDVEGNLVQLDVEKSETFYYSRYECETKVYEIIISGTKLKYKCKNTDEISCYDAVFDYLKTCTNYSNIHELIEFLIEKCIEKLQAKDASQELTEILYLHNEEEGEEYNTPACFIVMELVKLITQEE